MSDTYTLNPSIVSPGSGNVTITYTSNNFTDGTTYTLKSFTGTTLASQSITTPTITSFNSGTGMWAMASDSNGNIYIQNTTSKTISIYNSSGTSTGSTIAGLTQSISTCASSDPNLIYWAGTGFFRIMNASAKTLTSYSSVPDLFAIGFNSSDGYVYGGRVNLLHIYKINPSNGTYTTIFTNNGTYGLPASENNMFQGITVGGDGNLYGITRTEGSIWKFTTSGTPLGLFVALPNGNGVGLVYSSVSNCFYAQFLNGAVYKVSSSGSYTTLRTGTGGTFWGSYFNPYTNTYILNNNGLIYKLTFNSTISYTFSSNLLNYRDASIKLYNGSTPFGIDIVLFILYPCFLEGSKILRFNPDTYQDEYIAVERLRPGDLVVTAESGYKSIHSIGYKTIVNPRTDPNPSNRLYKFSCKEMFEPLYITGEHCTLHREISTDKLAQITEHMGDVYITEEFYRIPAFLDDRATPYDGKDEPATIWHFALEHENVAHNYGVFANGLLVESCAIESLMDKSGMRLLE